MIYRSNSTIGELLLEGFLGMMLILLLLAIFLAVKAGELVVKTYTRYGKQYKWLWFVPLPAVLCTILFLIFQNEPVFPALAVASFLAFLIVCKGVELHNKELFMRESNVKAFLTEVKHPMSWLSEE